MRFNVAGLFLLTILATLSTAQPARGQTATGEVQAVGFNGYHRPDAWVPMVVRIKPDTPAAGNYQVRVYQHDQDGDRAVYVRAITVDGSAAGEQSFWMYFLPEPTHGGLSAGGGTLHELQKELVVFLCDAKGKQLTQLPVTSTLENVDPNHTGYGSGGPTRGNKLVLAVSANGSQQPPLGELLGTSMVGMTQGMEVVNLRAKDLPSDPLGYEPVDAVLWLGGDPADLDAGGAHGLAALSDWVRFGGQLVVTQPTENWKQTASFGDLLPVDVTGVASKPTFEPLKSMAVPPDSTDGTTAIDQWVRVRPPFTMARATARPGAVVDRWIDWKEDGSNADATPYLARRAAGLGQVTWVAQPLTTDAQPSNPSGWPYVWLTVLGWRNDAYVPPPLPSGPNAEYPPEVKVRIDQYQPGKPVDLGYSLAADLNLGNKGAWLVALAIGFFVVYWLLAGPGTYAYLVAKKRQGLSWFFFAAAALVATAVTVGVVKLVLRGPPEVRHLSVVRVAPGQPTIVFSRFGLYIPRDGDQTIELQDTTPGQLSYLSALAEHPQQLGDASEFPAPLDYDVPVRDLGTTDAPSLTVPYRSSLKKFQARWVGELPQKINGGGIKLDESAGRLPLEGTLSNDTGVDLNDVYLAFHVSRDKDWMVYVPSWPKGTTLDLQRDLNAKSSPPKSVRVGQASPMLAEPGDGHVISGEVSPPGARGDRDLSCWANYWGGRLRGGGDDMERDLPLNLSFPIMSVLDRIAPMPNGKDTKNTNNGLPTDYTTADRVDLYARGGRMLDAGPSLSAGQLLVIATAKGPLPIPVDVDGDRMVGDGTTLYQFLLPIDRGDADKPGK
jgi:hypothetical protein